MINDGAMKSESAGSTAGQVIGNVLSILLIVLGTLVLFTSGPAFFRYSGFLVLVIFGCLAGIASWLRVSGGLWSVVGIALLSFPMIGLVAVTARYVFHAEFQIDREYYVRWMVFLVAACVCLAVGRRRRRRAHAAS